MRARTHGTSFLACPVLPHAVGTLILSDHMKHARGCSLPYLVSCAGDLPLRPCRRSHSGGFFIYLIMIETHVNPLTYPDVKGYCQKALACACIHAAAIMVVV